MENCSMSKSGFIGLIGVMLLLLGLGMLGAGYIGMNNNTEGYGSNDPSKRSKAADDYNSHRMLFLAGLGVSAFSLGPLVASRVIKS